MSRYILLTPNQTIKAGDEYRTSIVDWRPHNGWTGRKVRALLNLVGATGQMRRKSNKKVIRKTCVKWR